MIDYLGKEKMKIEAIIWDIGGVLERTEDPTPRRALANRLGWQMDPLMELIFGSRDGYRVQLGLISYHEHLQNLGEILGQTQAEIKQTISEFFAGDRLDMDLVDNIRQLKHDYTTAVLSNYSSLLREKINQQWHIADAFDHLIISAEVGVKKPDPEIYQLTLERVGCLPGQAVFIDDAIENIDAAHSAGIHAVHFQNPAQAWRELSTLLADHNIPNESV